MPSFRSAFPSKFMKASDLNGRAVVATIASVDSEEVGKDQRYVVRFVEAGVKPLVLNLTNGETISDVAGSEDVDDWPGQKIEIFPSSTSFQGKRVACLRVRVPRKPQRGPAQAGAARRSSAKDAPDPDDVDEAMPTDGGEY
jgi:hypothetical protein